MCTILCLAATHLSTLRPQLPRYSHVALQLLGKSASLFGEKLSSPVTAQNSEALIATSILMQYISWSHVEFLEEQGKFPNHKEHSSLIMELSRDPLLQLSSGVRGIIFEAYPILWGSGSVFLSACLYSPRSAIEEAILQRGEDPNRFVDHFMAIWDDPRYQAPPPEKQEELPRQSSASPRLDVFTDGEMLPGYACLRARLNYVCAAFKTLTHGACYKPSPQGKGSLGCVHAGRAETEIVSASLEHTNPDPRRIAFERVARRLSLLFCLVSLSASAGQSPPQSLTHLQPDIERCFFTFPVLCGAIFRDLALQGDSRALVMLCHFYRAARILLTSSTSWWARQRSHLIESLILRELISRGLETGVLGEVCETGS